MHLCCPRPIACQALTTHLNFPSLSPVGETAGTKCVELLCTLASNAEDFGLILHVLAWQMKQVAVSGWGEDIMCSAAHNYAGWCLHFVAQGCRIGHKIWYGHHRGVSLMAADTICIQKNTRCDKLYWIHIVTQFSHTYQTFCCINQIMSEHVTIQCDHDHTLIWHTAFTMPSSNVCLS